MIATLDMDEKNERADVNGMFSILDKLVNQNIYPVEVYDLLRDMMNIKPAKRPELKIIW